MAHKIPHLPDDLREPHTVEWPGFSRFYLKAIAVTILVGLVTGVLWIAWNLIRIHVFG